MKICQSTTVEIYMVNSTCRNQVFAEGIYNSRNLYGQFDRAWEAEADQSTTVEIYMVNSTSIMRIDVPKSTTVEIYMVNSTCILSSSIK